MRSNGLMYTLVHWVISAAALLLTAYLVRGFKVKNFSSAMLASVVIGCANVLIWPILMFLTFPLNILTLGLFTFVVNGMVLRICAALLPGFEINSWMAAVFGAVVLSLVGTGLHYFLI